MEYMRNGKKSLDSKTWSKFLYRTRILKRLREGGSASLSPIIRETNLNYSDGRSLIFKMDEEGLITLTSLGRMTIVEINSLGHQYLTEFKRFCDVIETLKNPEA